MNSKLLLATGQARSGTTVLTKCIAEHPQVHSTGVESNVLNDIVNASMRGSTMRDRRDQMVVSLQDYHAAFRRLIVDILWPSEKMFAGKFTPQSPPKAVSTFSSLKVENADELVNMFPDIHIACIVRNGIEVVASRMNHEHIGKLTFEEHCRAWSRAVDMVRWGEDKDCFTLVLHENLLDPETAARQFDQLFDNAGLTRSNQPLQLLQQRDHHRTRVEGESDDDQRDMSKRRQRWRYWTGQQRKMFIDICGEAMGYFGYAIEVEGV